MTDHKIDLSDNSKANDKIGPEPEVKVSSKKEYRVTGQDGLYKNGKNYPKGTVIELDETTANNFKSVGGVEDV